MSILNVDEEVKNIISDDADFTPEGHETFEELGIESLDRIEIITNIESRFDIELDDIRLDGLNNVQGLIDYVEEVYNAY